MIKIGLIGEHSNDTDSIAQLMRKKYNVGFHYKTLSVHKYGSQIYNESSAKTFNFEIKKYTPHCVIIVADADAIITETTRIRYKRTLCERLSKMLNSRCILLLNIYELEALIFADLDRFNTLYNTSIKGNRDVSFIEKPKDELKSKSKLPKKFKESDCSVLFNELIIDIVSKNCSYFKTFLHEFSELIDAT